jgi:hypothetical protein
MDAVCFRGLRRRLIILTITSAGTTLRQTGQRIDASSLLAFRLVPFLRSTIYSPIGRQVPGTDNTGTLGLGACRQLLLQEPDC